MYNKEVFMLLKLKHGLGSPISIHKQHSLILTDV